MVKKEVIDLSNAELLKEGYVYNEFSNQVNRMLLGLSYAGVDVPISVRGTTSQIEAFFNALSNERRYMTSYVKHGLDNSRTLNNRHRLMDAVKNFEKETGLRWPFKN